VSPVTSTLLHAQYLSAMRMLDDDLYEQGDGRLTREKERRGKKRARDSVEKQPVAWETITKEQDRYIVPP
jgi:hypothetical protein